MVKDGPTRIRAELTQEEIGVVQQSTRAVEVRLAGDITRILQGSVSQEVPAATFTLPSPVLGAGGGGRLAVDAQRSDGLRTAQMVFLLDINLPELQKGSRYGERAYILFRHPAEPLATRVYRTLRQLFITKAQG